LQRIQSRTSITLQLGALPLPPLKDGPIEAFSEPPSAREAPSAVDYAAASACVRAVLGRAGATVRQLELETGAAIAVDRDGEVSIEAPDPESAEAAREAVLRLADEALENGGFAPRPEVAAAAAQRRALERAAAAAEETAKKVAGGEGEGEDEGDSSGAATVDPNEGACVDVDADAGGPVDNATNASATSEEAPAATAAEAASAPPPDAPLSPARRALLPNGEFFDFIAESEAAAALNAKAAKNARKNAKKREKKKQKQDAEAAAHRQVGRAAAAEQTQAPMRAAQAQAQALAEQAQSQAQQQALQSELDEEEAALERQLAQLREKKAKKAAAAAAAAGGGGATAAAAAPRVKSEEEQWLEAELLAAGLDFGDASPLTATAPAATGGSELANANSVIAQAATSFGLSSASGSAYGRQLVDLLGLGGL
jgi:hypothetical protein